MAAQDDLVRRGKVYYGKLVGARTMFVAPRLIRAMPSGDTPGRRARRLGRPAQAILRVLRREWWRPDLQTTPE